MIDAEDRSDLEPLDVFPDDGMMTTRANFIRWTTMSSGCRKTRTISTTSWLTITASGSRSPHLDAFRQRGIEVLYFTHPVDAMLPMGMADFKGHKLVSVDSAELDLDDVGEVSETAGGVTLKRWKLTLSRRCASGSRRLWVSG